jgi:translocation and assembly module TamB
MAGRYANSGGQIDEATVTGPDLTVKASGGLSLGEVGSSNLSYHVETSDLGAISKVAGQDQLQGFVSLDGRVTGNRTALGTRGQLTGGNLRYGSAEALTARSSYDALVPDLDAARGQVKADTTLGFLKAGGQDIGMLHVATTYGSRELAFDAVVEQSSRSGRVVGTVLLHPDHQEVHLSRFDVTTQGMTWALASGTEPAVQYGGGTVAIDGLRVVSGSQSVVVDGAVGRTSSNLRAALTDVDLAHVDTWLTGDRRLGGILNASARVTGPASALNVSGDFSVNRGAFREFRYDTLGGSVSYGQDRLAVDVRLQQDRQAWLVARGTLPTALFRPPTTAAGVPAPGSDAPVDLTVRSSPVDLAVVQGFTSAITKASGTVVVDAHLGGTAGTPQMSGRVEFTNGAFMVAPAGVSYRALSGRVDLQPGRAVIGKVSVTDEHDHTMALSGAIGLEGRSLGALKLNVASNKFELLHNDIGRVTVNSDLTVGGEIRAPEVRGQIAVNTASVNLDRVLELATSSAYSTRPASAGVVTDETAGGRQPVTGATNASVPIGAAGRGQTSAAGSPAVPQGAEPGSGRALDAALVDVTLKVPDDLALNGKDIQPGNTPIGLGNVNVTLGGDLRISKRPARPIRVVGQVNAVRGSYEFQGRRFDIQRGGRARFDGLVPVNPTLDIAATRLLSGVEARVHIGGTMRKPELTLTSSPPLEQADILSLIIFNAPVNELGEGQQVSLAQRAGALATGFVAGKLADSIGKALNLDVFEIQTEATPGGGQGATVTLGEQVGRNVYFKVVQGVGSDTTSRFVLDYQLADFLRLETTVSQGTMAMRSLTYRDQSGVDLIFFFSY